MKRKRTGAAKVLACFLLCVCFCQGAVAAEEAISPVTGTPDVLIVGGTPFGIALESDGAVVVGLTEIKVGPLTRRPAYEAGIRPGDVIQTIDGRPTKTVDAVREKIENGLRHFY